MLNKCTLQILLKSVKFSANSLVSLVIIYFPKTLKFDENDVRRPTAYAAFITEYRWSDGMHIRHKKQKTNLARRCSFTNTL